MEQNPDRPHEATPFHREQARRQGRVPKSQDLASAVMLICAILVLMYFGKSLTAFFADYTTGQFTDAWSGMDRDAAIGHLRAVMLRLGMVLFPIFGLMLAAALAVNLGQVGFLFLPEQLAWDFNRINPINGLMRLFTLGNTVRLALAIFKVFVVGAVAVWSLWGEKDALLGLSSHGALRIGGYLIEVVLWTSLKIGIALLILALIDYAYQLWKHEQDLRMTDQQMREEMRTLQGDPQVIARRRAVQRQLVMSRMNQLIPQADVVVTNPTELAVAIRFDIETMALPVVVAKGAGLLAQRIRRLALESDVPIVERKSLARALYEDVEINQPIPEEQHAAVAEVLRYVYELKGIPLPTRET